jgi:hypothetical protein
MQSLLKFLVVAIIVMLLLIVLLLVTVVIGIVLVPKLETCETNKAFVTKLHILIIIDIEARNMEWIGDQE